MEIAPEQEHDQAIAVAQEDEQAIALPQEDPSSRQLKGIRLREWGKWVSEIRMPNCRRKIWLGSYKTPEQAARAYDAAMYFLRGPKYQFFNFPDSVPGNPSASPLSPKQIKEAARKYALGQPLSSLPSLENSMEHNNNEEQAFSVSDIELSSDKQQISDELQDLASFWSQLEESDGTGLPNSDNVPSMDDLSTPELFPTSQEQPEEPEEGYISVDLWNFRDY